MVLCGAVQTLRGGWDQSQYGYWATVLSEQGQLDVYIGQRSLIQRSQNAFAAIEQYRINKLSENWCVCPSRHPSGAYASTHIRTHTHTPSTAHDTRVSRCDRRRVHPDADVGVKFVAWDDASRCASAEDVKQSWEWRQQCMYTLLLSAVALQRHALVDPDFVAVYNLGHLRRWCVCRLDAAAPAPAVLTLWHRIARRWCRFPITTIDRAKSFGQLSKDATELASAPVVSVRSVVTDTIESAMKARWRALQSVRVSHRHVSARAVCVCVCVCVSVFQASVIKVAVPSPSAASNALWALATPQLRDYLFKFVMPTPPDRLSFKCMRDGGPLSDTNKNPTCGSPRRKDKDHADVYETPL